MNRLLFVSGTLFCAILFSGCGHTPVRTSFPAALPPHQVTSEAAAKRGDALKKILEPAKIKGIGLFPAAFKGHFSDAEVLDAVQISGFNRIYCQLTSEQELDERLVNFIAAAAKRGIELEIVLHQQDFYRSYRTNRLMRPLTVNYPGLFEATEMTVKFTQEKLPENIRISGITVIIAPQTFNHVNTERLHGKLYRWEESRYGIGADNDMLTIEALETVKKISAIPGLPPLTVAIPDFLHNAAVDGKLSCGKVTDFLPYVKQLAVISSANLPSKVPGTVQDELAALAKDGKKLLVVIPLAGHTSITEGRLRRRNWSDFQRTMDNFIKKSAASPAFGGVIITPLAVVEYLRQEI